MTAFSLGTVWEETIAFLRRESGLLLPVGFATFGLAQILFDLGMPEQQSVDPARIGGSPAALLVLPALLLMLIGNLAVTRIALVSGGSVGESLSAALRSLPKALIAVAIVSLIMIGIALIVVIAATVGAIAFRTDPKAVTPNIVYLLTIPMLIALVRLMLLVPVLALEDIGAVAALRRALALSREHFLRLVGVFMILLLVSTLVGVLQLFVLGSLFKLLAFATGDSELVLMLQAVVRAGIASVLSLAVTTYIALLYRHVTA